MFNTTEQPDFLQPKGCRCLPSYHSTEPNHHSCLHQQNSFIRSCSFPFIFNMGRAKGHSLPGPRFWYAAPVGTAAELGPLVCSEGQYGLVISAGEGWEVGTPRFSCQLSHFASLSSKWEYHLPAPQACHEDWLTLVDIFKREGGSSPDGAAKRLHVGKQFDHCCCGLSSLSLYEPRPTAVKRLAAVRHKYRTQQLQNKWLLSKGKVACL